MKVKGFVDIAAHDDCWNLRDSYGEICVGCKCCNSNKICESDMYRRRIYKLKELLDEEGHFNEYDENVDIAKIQKKNVESNIKYYKRTIRKYKKILKTFK